MAQLPTISQNLLLLGQTRSGKSFFGRYLLKTARKAGWRLVIADPKKQWMVREDESGKRTTLPFGELTKEFRGSVDQPILVTKFDPTIAVMIIQPVEWEDWVDQFFKDVLEYGDTICYFDEITQYVSNSYAPKTFKVMWTQGLAKGIKVWAGNQRPKMLPEDLKSQSSTIIIFRIIKLEDREAIADYLPNSDEIVDEALKPRWFWYWSEGMDKPVLFAPLKIQGT